MNDPYRAHAAFIRPAWPVRDIWRVMTMIVLVELIFVLSPVGLVLLLPDAARDAHVAGTGALGTLLHFFSFGVAGLGLVGLLPILHGRGFWSLVGGRGAAWAKLKALRSH